VNREEYRRLFLAEGTHWWFAGMRAITDAILLPYMGREGRTTKRPLILDAGCGTGSNLEYLGGHGDAVGVDLSPDAVAFCKERGVKVVQASVLALPFKDGLFDCVASFDVLYHRWIESDPGAIRELVRTVAPGGLLLLRLPAFEMLRGAHDEAVHTRHRYTRSEVASLLKGADLEILRLTYTNSLLFPLMALRRALDRLTGSTDSDVEFLPRPIEWVFRRILGVEAFLLRYFSFPVGSSIVALARRGEKGRLYNAGVSP
jgi:SAM-dependent methyltransferase